jgi:hypothetical protein
VALGPILAGQDCLLTDTLSNFGAVDFYSRFP